jgi:glycosyltransferase involved in cell wall biosynthesis
MESELLVTVLMPNLNGSDFLTEAIESVYAQNVKFEMVVVDNGSTDRSIEILENFARTKPNFRFISHPHKGVSRALQEGIRHVTTDFIARLDSDDKMYPQRLSTQLLYMIANPKCVLVSSQITYINEKSEMQGASRYPVGSDIRRFLSSTNPIAHPATLMKTSAIREVDGYRTYSEGAEDLDLWFRLAKIGELCVLGEELTFYRQHAKQVTKRNLYKSEIRVRFFHLFSPISIIKHQVVRIAICILLGASHNKFWRAKLLIKRLSKSG